ncbi:DUF5753 domain-containing protein [Actinomadura chibensis]|uniref:DUF5753 domain-containing protein n=1 Tax=Actinomadura chibensis TaxID=392828 RepID=A0A5D0NM12_9ACTN|nr:DUF5753 domain-containing protein [Actinomadura chibensis]TYB45507.1 hypothetical protein FXF69_18935 [Actinomadura chibensis]
MTDEPKRIVEAFSRELHAAYHKAGIRRYTDVEDRSERIYSAERADGGTCIHVSRSAAYKTLTGDRERMPSWDQVAQLVRVFRAEAADRGIDPDSVGTLAGWKARYEAAAAEFRAAKKAAPSPVPAPAAAVPAAFSDGPQTWWRAYADIVPAWSERYLNHEPLSDRITSYEKTYVPGLLQTPEYAAAVIRLGHGDEPEDRIARRVELRMLRQRHLARDGARPRMWAIINEGALRDGPVGGAAMRAQLRHLRMLGPYVQVQVIPADHPAHDAADGPITLLRFPSRQFQDLVFLEHADSALYPSSEEDLAHYLHAVQKLGLAALMPGPSRELLRRLEAEI